MISHLLGRDDMDDPNRNMAISLKKEVDVLFKTALSQGIDFFPYRDEYGMGVEYFNEEKFVLSAHQFYQVKCRLEREIEEKGKFDDERYYINPNKVSLHTSPITLQENLPRQYPRGTTRPIVEATRKSKSPNKVLYGISFLISILLLCTLFVSGLYSFIYIIQKIFNLPSEVPYSKYFVATFIAGCVLLFLLKEGVKSSISLIMKGKDTSEQGIEIQKQKITDLHKSFYLFAQLESSLIKYVLKILVVVTLAISSFCLYFIVIMPYIHNELLK